MFSRPTWINSFHWDLDDKFTKQQVEVCIKRVSNVNPQARQNTSNLRKGVLLANFLARVNKAKDGA